MRYTQRELLSLLGEITAISLESEECSPGSPLTYVVVYLEIDGKRVELIRDLRTGDGIISHAITRSGIAHMLQRASE